MGEARCHVRAGRLMVGVGEGGEWREVGGRV